MTVTTVVDVVYASSTAVHQQLQNTPVQVLCPNCHAAIWTVVNYDIGMLTYVISVALCFIGCNLGCCLIPFCIDDCKDAIHTCPICNVEIGRWKRM
ncbi:hypothetical protein NP493_829g01080 [Ridgeia piscesae]|uniref:LITAF domain-containing protein n=1 Tax=Ridgeia piscesae TaxID=27915 RepID=A0AAD9KM50_RIDPI|nr:hypothetical protein NP493_829g01080 [Ridgeia piscesae]